MKHSEIKEIREKLGLTQTAFGDMIGKSLRQIQYYESGEQEIPRHVETLVRLMMKQQEMVSITAPRLAKAPAAQVKAK